MTAIPENSVGPTDGKDPPEYDVFDQALMRNSLRKQIIRRLRQRPGMNRHQLAVSLGVHVNGIQHHVNRLLQAKFLEARRSSKGREILLFTPDLVHLWDNRSTRVLFGREPPLQVADYFVRNPGSDTKKAAEELDLSIYNIRRQLHILEENNLIERLRVDRHVIYRAAPELKEWLQDTGKVLGEQWWE